MACGHSRRESVWIVNTIIERMIEALKRGRKVEFPFGYLQKVKRMSFSYRDKWNDWYWDRSEYIVEYVIDRRGWLELIDLEREPSSGKAKRG